MVEAGVARFKKPRRNHVARLISAVVNDRGTEWLDRSKQCSEVKIAASRAWRSRSGKAEDPYTTAVSTGKDNDSKRFHF